jgi:ElaA protein
MDDVRVAAFADFDNRTLYALLRLRVDVFVVEQNCPYPELDGRDTDPATRHLWTEDGTGPTAYLRLLPERAGAVHRIGRVCTRADARGQDTRRRCCGRRLRGWGPASWCWPRRAH